MARIFDVILAKGGNPEKTLSSHPEFISVSIIEMLKQVQHDKKKPGLPRRHFVPPRNDGLYGPLWLKLTLMRLRGNDIRHFFRAMQQRHCRVGMTSSNT
nr:hypothetical protein [Rickettsia endosymbiont of Ceutorhynchus assimilis]